MKSLEKILEWVLSILIVLGCYKLIELGTVRECKEVIREIPNRK